MCLVILFDQSVARNDRAAALTAISALLLFLLFRVPFGVRGFGLGAQFLALVLVLSYLRPHLQERTLPTNGQYDRAA